MRIIPSAFEHGVTEADIEHVLQWSIREITPHGPDQDTLWVGYDPRGQPLEIVGSYYESNSPPRIFHAMPLRSNWYHLLQPPKRGRRR